MKTYTLRLITWVAVGLLVSLPAMAQRPMGRNQMNRQMPMFNTAAIDTLSGTVDQLVLNPSPYNLGLYGVHLMLATAEGEMDVHLGPAWYLDDQKMQFQEGDQITVIGAHMNVDGTPALIAARIERGEEVLQLRDAAGRPLWRGQRRAQ